MRTDPGRIHLFESHDDARQLSRIQKNLAKQEFVRMIVQSADDVPSVGVARYPALVLREPWPRQSRAATEKP